MADKNRIMPLLKTARGQLDGIISMVEDDRYCIDISHQLMSTAALIGKVNREVLAAHLKNCVKNTKDEQEMDRKIDELIDILGRGLR